MLLAPPPLQTPLLRMAASNLARVALVFLSFFFFLRAPTIACDTRAHCCAKTPLNCAQCSRSCSPSTRTLAPLHVASSPATATVPSRPPLPSTPLPSVGGIARQVPSSPGKGEPSEKSAALMWRATAQPMRPSHARFWYACSSSLNAGSSGASCGSGVLRVPTPAPLPTTHKAATSSAVRTAAMAVCVSVAGA